jgi:hypothetical protein
VVGVNTHLLVEMQQHVLYGLGLHRTQSIKLYLQDVLHKAVIQVSQTPLAVHKLVVVTYLLMLVTLEIISISVETTVLVNGLVLMVTTDSILELLWEVETLLMGTHLVVLVESTKTVVGTMDLRWLHVLHIAIALVIMAKVMVEETETTTPTKVKIKFQLHVVQQAHRVTESQVATSLMLATESL